MNRSYWPYQNSNNSISSLNVPRHDAQRTLPPPTTKDKLLLSTTMGASPRPPPPPPPPRLGQSAACNDTRNNKQCGGIVSPTTTSSSAAIVETAKTATTTKRKKLFRVRFADDTELNQVRIVENFRDYPLWWPHCRRQQRQHRCVGDTDNGGHNNDTDENDDDDGDDDSYTRNTIEEDWILAQSQGSIWEYIAANEAIYHQLKQYYNNCIQQQQQQQAKRRYSNTVNDRTASTTSLCVDCDVDGAIDFSKIVNPYHQQCMIHGIAIYGYFRTMERGSEGNVRREQIHSWGRTTVITTYHQQLRYRQQLHELHHHSGNQHPTPTTALLRRNWDDDDVILREYCRHGRGASCSSVLSQLYAQYMGYIDAIVARFEYTRLPPGMIRPTQLQYTPILYRQLPVLLLLKDNDNTVKQPRRKNHYNSTQPTTIL